MTSRGLNKTIINTECQAELTQYQHQIGIRKVSLTISLELIKNSSQIHLIYRMRLKIFMALSLLCYTNAQVDRDWSFQQMCEFWGGEQTYRARSGYKVQIYDLSTDVMDLFN